MYVFLQIPHGMVPSSSYSYQLSVNGTGGAKFSELRYIRFKEKGFTIYIQTDKAIYKPGQNGKNLLGYSNPDMKIISTRFFEYCAYSFLYYYSRAIS